MNLKGKGKAPTGKKPDIRPPKFITDLYRDLRDQRLLPLVILLLIAIPAVPIVLGDPTEAFVAPPPDEGLASVVADDSLMVVSAPGGLRRHGERFANRDPRDPFVDPNAPEAVELPVDTGPVGPGGSGSDMDPDIEDPIDDDGGSFIPPMPPSGDSGRTEPAPPSKDDSLVLFRLKTSVRFGKAGSGLLHTFGDIDRMRGLPKVQPIAIFVGASEDAKRAVFSISADASRVTGAGSCSSGRPKDCQFLTLRVGKAANIHDARRGVIWRLGVNSIELVETEVGEVKSKESPAGLGGGQGRDGKGSGGGGGAGAEPVAPDVVKATSLNEVIGLYLLK